MKNKIFNSTLALLLAAVITLTCSGCKNTAAQPQQSTGTYETTYSEASSVAGSTTSSDSSSKKNTSSSSSSKSSTSISDPSSKKNTSSSSSSKSNTSSAANKSKLRYREEMLNVSENNIINTCIKANITDSDNLFYKYSDDSQWKFFNFRKTGIVGIGLNSSNAEKMSNPYDNTSNTAFTEMYFGLYAKIEDNKTLYVSSYSHIKEVSCKNITVKYERDTVTPEYNFYGTYLTADLRDDSFPNGLYVINGTFDYKSQEYQCNLYMIVNCSSDDEDDYEFYICCADSRLTDEESPSERRKKLEKMISSAGITPENSLNTNIAYPYEANNIADYDTEYWLEKSHEIVKGYENTSSAFKATLLHDWMTSNLIYDSYKVNVLVHPRYDDENVELESKDYYVSNIKIGVCRDFANIYTIMCREQGIPCIMYCTQTHVWNGIYINGEWLEVDITGDIQRYAESEDINDVTKAKNSNLYMYKYYCNYKDNKYPDSINELLHFY